MSFMKPKMPPPAPPPPPVTPIPDATDATARQAQADALAMIKKRRGRASTIMSGTTGDTTAPPTRRRQLGYGQAS
ncbi:MAG: hypothetical protein EBR82_08070 [Caulobacteraceae bacterium]|nr:hypothetical protein [Caulobacteraceae bacterium]